MSTWPRVPPLYGAVDHDAEVVRPLLAPAGVVATSSPNTEQVPIISHAADPELGMVTLVPAVLCSHCNQHLSPIDICVTVVLLVSSSCNLLPICFNHIILY